MAITEYKSGTRFPGVIGRTPEVSKLAWPEPNRLAQGGATLVGADAGAPVTPEYKPPVHFTGAIKRIIVEVSGEHVEDYEAQTGPRARAVHHPRNRDRRSWCGG